MLQRDEDTLGALRPGERAVIVALDAGRALHLRLTALGLSAGKTVRVMRRARFGGTYHVRVGTTELMLRVPDACRVRVRRLP